LIVAIIFELIDGVIDLENMLFKQIVKLVLILVIPLAILSIFLYKVQPEIAIAFFVGALLGIFRLKEFWGYIAYNLNSEKQDKSRTPFIKYLASLVITITAVSYVLFKSQIVGLAMLIGLVVIPIVVTIYAAFTGISLYKKK
jgi:hypothetical protein